MDKIGETLRELGTILPNFKIEYFKAKFHSTKNGFSIDNDRPIKTEFLIGRSKLCECEESEYSLLITIDTRKESEAGKDYEIRIQEDMRDRFSQSYYYTKCCRKCEKYHLLNKRIEDLKTKIKIF